MRGAGTGTGQSYCAKGCSCGPVKSAIERWMTGAVSMRGGGTGPGQSVCKKGFNCGPDSNAIER